MNESDYIVTLAPMRTKLKLKGHACDLFALIYGYSKDGENTCRASLTYLAEWLGTDRHAVSKLIKRLEQAGYINKHEYLRGAMKCYEYTSNYGAMLAKAERGEKMGLPTSKTVVKTTTVVKNTTVVKTTQKCCQNDHESVVKMTTNNTIENNIDNIFSCASPAGQEKEKEDFYKIFFFRNAADPAVEVERFLAYNESLGWANGNGRRYDTAEQRAGLAKLWTMQADGQWARQDYLNAVKEIYDRAVKEDISGVEALIDHRVRLVWNGANRCWCWEITPEARRWVQVNSDIVHEALDASLRGSKVIFKMIQ